MQLPVPLQIWAKQPGIKGADQRGRQHVRNIRHKIDQAKREADALVGTIIDEYGDTREIRKLRGEAIPKNKEENFLATYRLQNPKRTITEYNIEHLDPVGSGAFGQVFAGSVNPITNNTAVKVITPHVPNMGIGLSNNFAVREARKEILQEAALQRRAAQLNIAPEVRGVGLPMDRRGVLQGNIMMKDLRMTHLHPKTWINEASGNRNTLEIKTAQQKAVLALNDIELRDRHDRNILVNELTGRPQQIDYGHAARIDNKDAKTRIISNAVIDGFRYAGLEDETLVFRDLINELLKNDQVDDAFDIAKQGMSRLMKLKGPVKRYISTEDIHGNIHGNSTKFLLSDVKPEYRYPVAEASQTMNRYPFFLSRVVQTPKPSSIIRRSDDVGLSGTTRDPISTGTSRDPISMGSRTLGYYIPPDVMNRYPVAKSSSPILGLLGDSRDPESIGSRTYDRKKLAYLRKKYGFNSQEMPF